MTADARVGKIMEPKTLDQDYSEVPDISIVMVSWNTRSCLVDCLQSIEEHKGASCPEVIVVDNASSDGSPELVKSRFPAVHLIRNGRNLGFARANNIGIGEARGRYIALVNSDVILLPGCFEKLIAFMDDNPGIGMVGPRILNLDGTIQPTARRFPTFLSCLCRTLALDRLLAEGNIFPSSFEAGFPQDAVKVEVLSGCFLVVRRKALAQVGLLDEHFFIYGEDIDWCKRFHMAGWGAALYPQAQAIHRGGASSSRAPLRFFVEMQKADLSYWRKYHGTPGWIYYMVMIFVHQVLRILPRVAEYAFYPSRRANSAHKIHRSLACIRWLLHV